MLVHGISTRTVLSKLVSKLALSNDLSLALSSTTAFDSAPAVVDLRTFGSVSPESSVDETDSTHAARLTGAILSAFETDILNDVNLFIKYIYPRKPLRARMSTNMERDKIINSVRTPKKWCKP